MEILTCLLTQTQTVYVPQITHTYGVSLNFCVSGLVFPYDFHNYAFFVQHHSFSYIDQSAPVALR